MAEKPIRIAIVGIGGIADMHAMAIGDLPQAELVGGSCRTEEKGRAFAEKFHCEWHADFQALYDACKPDVVTICTPSGAHLEPTVAAAKRGIHVLSEKPLEITLQRAQQMIDAASSNNVLLGGIFPQRFNPAVQAVYSAAKAGRFGRLALASAYVPWWRDDAYYAPSRWQGTKALDGGGAMINQSIHAIDAMAWIARATGAGKPQEVFGFTSQCGHDADTIEVEDMAVAAVRFESGALGSIVASTSMWPGGAQRVHFGGSAGSAEVHENQIVSWRFREEADADEELRAKFGAAADVGGAADPLAIDYSNHTRNIDDFLQAVTGEKQMDVTAEEACVSLAIIRGVYESTESGRPVSL